MVLVLLVQVLHEKCLYSEDFFCPYFPTFKKGDHFGKTLIKLHWLNHPSSALSKVMCFSDKKLNMLLAI